MPDWEPRIRLAIRELRDGMQAKITEAADQAMEHLRTALQTEASIPIEANGENYARQKAEEKLKDKIRKLEAEFRRRTLHIFGHHEDRWKLPESLEYDLFHEKTWQLFGFSKKTVIVASTLAGAATGTLIDIATGGGTMGIGALVGAFAGGGTALMVADKVANMKVVHNKLGGRSIKASIQHRGGFPGTLFGRTVGFSVAVVMRPHGNRTSDEKINLENTISKRLETNKDTGSKVSLRQRLFGQKSTRFQALIELWHRGKSGSKVEVAESWLRDEVVSYIESFAFPADDSDPSKPLDKDKDSTDGD